MSEQPVFLPDIRQDLCIDYVGTAANGEPCWLIHDRIKNSYFRISNQIMQLLNVWQPVEPEELLQVANARYDSKFTHDDVIALAEFLYSNSLSTTPPSGGYNGYFGQSLSGAKSWWMTLVHNYLFFRIPLFSPQQFLNRTWPFVSFLFTRGAVWFFVISAIIGLYLVSRQWSVFLSTFSSFLTLQGFALYAASLVLVKSLHELGHAYMAKRYNVDVPVIGAAFIVMMPILYTDTTAAWKLQDRKPRLMIDMAGIFTELALASICTLAWIFLPDGNLRAIAFTTATLSWVLSLTINLNPFMKFDGYYILSDWLRFENLQDRGFKLAKWWLRETLFATRKPPPETLPDNIRRFIICHAIGVWIYRFFLFLAIALLVYNFFFKLLGVFMFAVELIWFIGLPIWREIKEWWKMKKEIKNAKRYKKTLAIILAGIGLMAMPLSNSVRVPAIMIQSNEAKIHAPFPAQISKVFFHEGQQVKSGQLLVQLVSSDLEHQISNTLLEQSAIKARLARIHSDLEDRSQIQVLQVKFDSIDKRLSGLRNKQTELDIRATASGNIVDSEKNLHPGMWVNANQQFALIKSINATLFKALASDKDRTRITKSAKGVFYPDNINIPAIPVILEKLANVAGTGSELSYLSDQTGSFVPVENTKDGRLQPRGAWYALNFAPRKEIATSQIVTRGIIIVDAKSQSLLMNIFRRVASVLVREAGI